MACIYTLEDPRNPGVIRYVGKTSLSLSKRLYGHLRDTIRSNHKTNWVKSLLVDGVRPTISAIYQLEDETNWQTIERLFIKMIRDAGHPLTNIHAGGNGQAPCDISPDTRRRLSEASKLHSKESRERQAAKLRGVPRSPEIWEKIRTAATFAKISRALKGRPKTEDHKSAMRGRDFSLQHRAALSSAQIEANSARRLLGIPHPLKGRTVPTDVVKQISSTLRGRSISEETRSKISRALTGHKQTPEQIERRASKLRGRKLSQEHKAKLSEARRSRDGTKVL